MRIGSQNSIFVIVWFLGYFWGNNVFEKLTKFAPKSKFSPKLGLWGNFFKWFTTLKFKQFLKHAQGTKWELKALLANNLKLKNIRN